MKEKSKIIAALFMSLLIFSMPLTAERQAEQANQDYSDTERSQVPEAFTWRIGDVYESEDHWDKDKAVAERMLEGIGDMARGWTGSPARMLELLDRISEIEMKFNRLYYYAVLSSVTDMANSRYQLMKGQIEGLKVQMKGETAFMEHDVLNLGEEAFSRYLEAEAGLERYRFRVDKILRMKGHILPPDQQEIVSLAGLMCGGAEQAYNYMYRMEIPQVEVTLSDGRTVCLGTNNREILRSAPKPRDRTLMVKTHWQNVERFGRTMAALLNNGVREHLFSARVHNFKNCLEARLYEENIDPRIYHNLLQQVRENLGPFHRYLALKKEMLGLKKMHFEDVYAIKVRGMGKRYSYTQAKAVILDMVKPLGKVYSEVLRRAFDDRWIDVYSHKGKVKAAGSVGIYGVHPYVVTFFEGNYDSLAMLVHELGHAAHFCFSEQNQAFCNYEFSHFLAEIVAVFNEHVLVRYLLEKESSDLFRLYVLENYLDIFTTHLYRFALFAELELAMHNRVEKGNTLTADWLNSKYLELHRFYYGEERGILEVGDFIRSQWEALPVLFQNFYTYTYSIGQVASLALMDMVFNGAEKERERYLGILKSGGSAYPLDQLKTAGVDLNTPKPYSATFKHLDDMVGEMEKTVRRFEKQGKL